jgi:hypothetical protein
MLKTKMSKTRSIIRRIIKYVYLQEVVSREEMCDFLDIFSINPGFYWADLFRDDYNRNNSMIFKKTPGNRVSLTREAKDIVGRLLAHHPTTILAEHLANTLPYANGPKPLSKHGLLSEPLFPLDLELPQPISFSPPQFLMDLELPQIIYQ